MWETTVGSIELNNTVSSLEKLIVDSILDQRIVSARIFIGMYNADKSEISKNQDLAQEIKDIRFDYFHKYANNRHYSERLCFENEELDRLLDSEFDGCSKKEFFDRYCAFIRKARDSNLTRKLIYYSGWIDLYHEEDTLDLDSE